MDWSTLFSLTSFLLALCLGLIIYYWFKVSNYHYWKTKNFPSTSPFDGLSGFTGKFKKRGFFEKDVEAVKKLGKVYGAYVGLSPILMVAEPELLRKILIKDFHVFTDRRSFDIDMNVIKYSLTALTGEDWRRVRSVVTPAFSTGKLKRMIRQMEDCAIPTTQHFVKAAESGRSEECKRIFGAFTMDIIASAAFGTKLDSASDPDNIFVQHAKKIFINEFPWRLILVVVFPRFAKKLGIEPFPIDTMQFFIDLIDTVVAKRNETKEVHEDFLQSLLDAQKNSTDGDDNHQDEEVVESVKDAGDEDESSYFKQYVKNKHISRNELLAQCILFFLAGYDTTATTISMVVYYLALNPKCQQEVVKEVDAIWKKYPELDNDALHETTYLDAAVSETLRMASPAIRSERKTLQDYPLEDLGITIPKDMYIQIPIYGMHYDPDIFPEPETFKPERFLPENKHLIQPYTYLPFGAGPRNCIGMRFALMEIKVCLLHVFRSVTFERCPETKVPVEVFGGGGLFQPKAVTLKVNKRNT